MNIFDTLEKFLNKYKISGIFFIPEYGSATIFKNDLDKLAVLDYAKLEIDVEKKKRENEIAQIINNDNSIIKNKKRDYIR